MDTGSHSMSPRACSGRGRRSWLLGRFFILLALFLLLLRFLFHLLFKLLVGRQLVEALAQVLQARLRRLDRLAQDEAVVLQILGVFAFESLQAFQKLRFGPHGGVAALA